MNDDRRDEILLDIHSKLEMVCARVDDHHGTLYGNGQPGLSVKLQQVSVQQRDCPARLHALRDNRMFLVAFGAVAVSFASFIYVVIVG